MTIPIDSKKEWRFLYHSAIDQDGIKCTVSTQENGNISIDASPILKLLLTSGTIEGTYTLTGRETSFEVTFKKDKKNNQYIGRPEGFHGIHEWKLWAVKADKQRCTIL